MAVACSVRTLDRYWQIPAPKSVQNRLTLEIRLVLYGVRAALWTAPPHQGGEGTLHWALVDKDPRQRV